MNPGCRVQDQLNANEPTALYITGRELNLRKLPGQQWESNPQPSEQLRPMTIKTSASTETATTATTATTTTTATTHSSVQLVLTQYNKKSLSTTSTHSLQPVLTQYNKYSLSTTLTQSNKYSLSPTSTHSVQQVLTQSNKYSLSTSTHSVKQELRTSIEL